MKHIQNYEKREQKLEAKKARIPKHGRNIGVIYKNVLEKRTSKD